ncbi:hypothetical protein IAU60_006842 [Kwoniella sp. DSM 27419]
MLGQLGHLPRFVRLGLIVTSVVIAPTLYLLYPSPEYVPSPGDVQAGGIDSDHWREPIQPNFEAYPIAKEEVREWEDEVVMGAGTDATREESTLSPAWAGVGAGVGDDLLRGGVIMPKLGNETAKAELGRAAWRVLHLMTLRYPDEPTEDDRLALKSFFHLFSRLYPCGECAAEFQLLLKEYPPQTSSRKVASLWLCHVHNQVNARLGKEEFDCLTLDATYDCGCGDEGASASGVSAPTGTGTGGSSRTVNPLPDLEDPRDLETDGLVSSEREVAHDQSAESTTRSALDAALYDEEEAEDAYIVFT